MSTGNRMFWLVLSVLVGAAWVSSMADVGEAVQPSRAAKEPVKKAPAPETFAPVTITKGQADTVLVIPSRYTIVQLAFDIARKHPMLIVAYDDQIVTNVPIIHVWNDSVQDWSRIALSQYTSGRLFDAPPSEAIIVGHDKVVPAGMAEGSKWAAKVTRVPVLGIVSLVNTLNDTFDFTSDEWRDLADRYGLTLKDLNAERRRWGKYGKPGEKKEPVVPMPRLKSAEVDKGLSSVPAPAAPQSGSVKPAIKDVPPENK